MKLRRYGAVVMLHVEEGDVLFSEHTNHTLYAKAVGTTPYVFSYWCAHCNCITWLTEDEAHQAARRGEL